MIPTIIGKSVRGDSHIRHGVECQDSLLIIDGKHRCNRRRSAASPYYDDLPEEVKIVAVADGHGSSSCPYSKTGSQTAVNVFCDLMAEYAVKFRGNMDELFASLNREGETIRISRRIVTEWEQRVLKVHSINGREMPVNEQNSKDINAVWKQYGTTLLGMLIVDENAFFLQLGDGDITFVNETDASAVLESEKILGVETHSISKPDSWKKVITKAVHLGDNTVPFMYLLSTDGWLNSHATQEDFYRTCREYYEAILNYGPEAVENNLENWLAETSKLGCGDDITIACVCFEGEQSVE